MARRLRRKAGKGWADSVGARQFEGRKEGLARRAPFRRAQGPEHVEGQRTPGKRQNPMRAGSRTTQHENQWRAGNPPRDTPAWEAELPSQVRAEAGASARGAHRGREYAGNDENARFRGRHSEAHRSVGGWAKFATAVGPVHAMNGAGGSSAILRNPAINRERFNSSAADIFPVTFGERPCGARPGARSDAWQTLGA